MRMRIFPEICGPGGAHAAQRTIEPDAEETAMDEATFNMSMRKYLKQVGVTSQQAIEKHVREHGDTSGRLKVRTVVSIEGHGMEHVVEGEIDLG